MPIIDSPAHIFPPDFGPAPAGCDPAGWPSTEPNPDVDGGKFLVNGLMRFPAKAVWFDAERRLEASAASGLDAEVLSPFPALLNYRAPAEVGRELCRVTNEYIAGLVAAFPTQFDGFWAEVDRIGAAVFVHGMPVPSERLPGAAVATFGVGAEATLGAAAIITGGGGGKYP